MGIDNDKDRGGRVLPGVKFSRIPPPPRRPKGPKGLCAAEG